MTTPTPATAVLVLLATTLVLSLLAWGAPGRARRPVLVLASLALLAASLVVAAVVPAPTEHGRGATTLFVALAGATAVAGGGPVTAWVFTLVDRQDQFGGPADPIHAAGRVLRGGAWIGALERAAVFASMATDVPEGLAVAVAVKALGRYPELRSGDSPGTAERFIIGTFTSVLWAVACAGLLHLPT